MVVRIRFGQGPVVTRRKGKNSRIALLVASGLTLSAISCFVLAIWRLGMDLRVTANFVFTSGVFSHWQVWMGAAGLAQYLCWKLTRHAREAQLPGAADSATNL